MPGKKILKNLLRVVGIVLFVYVLSRVNWPEFWGILKTINVIYFLSGLLLLMPAIFIRAWRWRELVLATGVNVSRNKSVVIFAKALFWGIVTPGKLGEFARARYLTEESDASLDKAIFTVVFDKITEFFMTAFLCIPAVLALSYLFEVDILLITLILALIIVSGTYFLVKRESGQKLLRPLLQIFVFDSLKKKAENIFDGFFEQVRGVNKELIFKLFGYELVSYFLTALVFLFMALSLGVSIPFWYLCLMIPLVTIITALPISVFGLGTREATFIFLFTFINLSLNQAVAFSFLLMFWSIASGLPGLLMAYWPTKKNN